ncbi:hypothetical protein L1D54_05410 [Vibrio brasiliensis]|uniref:hypothetical protein n=1 Tax=Vibrio brasiliensis TaxID=170652 RepID=UPI001EFC80B9|nr:hypothetical protein [Vibrio brasiliensis]MCG9749905.1 hypothetical protein [Vibrio brasiliensis]MCG9781826.1 hypothetical protein [Vibrio brasiliensis]
MPHLHCHCCNKKTAHKIVMKRCETQQDSVVKHLASFFATVFQGDHYVKMEKQAFCRVCNTQTEVSTQQDAFSGVKIA